MLQTKVPQSRDFFLAVASPRYPRSMITTLRTFARVVFTPVHLKRTLLIAFVVGSWLNLFNHGDELLRGAMDAHLAAKLALNYLTPFVVSNFGLLAHQRS
jgi:hypothetical protein